MDRERRVIGWQHAREQCHAARGLCLHSSQSCVRGCASLAMRASPSRLAASEAALPARACWRGLKGGCLRSPARMRCAVAARELLGRALLSRNSLQGARGAQLPGTALA